MCDFFFLLTFQSAGPSLTPCAHLQESWGNIWGCSLVCFVQWKQHPSQGVPFSFLTTCLPTTPGWTFSCNPWPWYTSPHRSHCLRIRLTPSGAASGFSQLRLLSIFPSCIFLALPVSTFPPLLFSLLSPPHFSPPRLGLIHATSFFNWF